MIISVRNTLPDQSQYTLLSNPEVAGTTTLRVANTNGLNAGWGIQLGKTGEEYAEVVVGTAASGSTITCPATRFPHVTDTPVYFIKWDQVVFERSTAGTAGTASPLSSGTVTITPDHPTTSFDDTSGSSSYGYRSFFRSSGLSTNSQESDWITSAGFDYYSLAKMRQRIKDHLWNATYLSDSMINDWINEWKEKMTNTAIGVNEDYMIGTTSVSYSGTQMLGTITATDFKQLKRVEYSENSNDSYKANKMYLDEYYPYQTFSAANPYFFMQGDNIIGRKPNTASGSFTLWYYRLDTPLVNDTDILPLSMRGYTKTFMDYCQAMAYGKDENKLDLHDRRLGDAMTGLDEFKRQIAPRNKTGPTQINYVESVGDQNTDWWL